MSEEEQINNQDKKLSRRDFFSKFKPSVDNLKLSQEESEEINQKLEKLNISRRDVLKAIGAGYVALMTGPVNEGLQRAGILEKGNIAEVSREVLESIVRYCTAEDQEQKDIEESFLKFNAGVIYGKQSGLDFSADLVTHFLYGDGEEYIANNQYIDVTQQKYNSAKRRGYEWIPVPEQFDSDEDLLRFHAQDMVNRVFNGDGGTYIQKEGNIITQENLSVSNGQNIVLFGVGGADRDEIELRDARFSLGEYTFAVKGQLLAVNGNNIILEHPTAEIQDTYDWSKTNGLRVGATLDSVADILNVSDHLPQEWLDRLSEIELEINDADGARLEEHGRAHSFEIKAEYELGNEPLELSVTHFS